MLRLTDREAWSVIHPHQQTLHPWVLRFLFRANGNKQIFNAIRQADQFDATVRMGTSPLHTWSSGINLSVHQFVHQTNQGLSAACRRRRQQVLASDPHRRRPVDSNPTQDVGAGRRALLHRIGVIQAVTQAYCVNTN